MSILGQIMEIKEQQKIVNSHALRKDSVDKIDPKIKSADLKKNGGRVASNISKNKKKK